jgi:hypothetical protein
MLDGYYTQHKTHMGALKKKTLVVFIKRDALQSV